MTISEPCLNGGERQRNGTRPPVPSRVTFNLASSKLADFCWVLRRVAPSATSKMETSCIHDYHIYCGVGRSILPFSTKTDFTIIPFCFDFHYLSISYSSLVFSSLSIFFFFFRCCVACRFDSLSPLSFLTQCSFCSLIRYFLLYN
jgi:hypothetical protein